MVRLAMEQKELKTKFEEEFANAHNQMMKQAARKEATPADDFEQSGEGGFSDEGSLEERKDVFDANLEERMSSVASKLEESVLLRMEAKLEEIVDAAVRLRIRGTENEQFEKSAKLEELVEKAVRLRLAAEQNQLDHSSTSRSGEVFYNDPIIYSTQYQDQKFTKKIALLLKESETSQIFQLAPLCHGCQGLHLHLEGFSHQNIQNHYRLLPLCFRFETSPDLPPEGWKLCDGQVLTAKLSSIFLHSIFPQFSFPVFSFHILTAELVSIFLAKFLQLNFPAYSFTSSYVLQTNTLSEDQMLNLTFCPVCSF